MTVLPIGAVSALRLGESETCVLQPRQSQRARSAADTRPLGSMGVDSPSCSWSYLSVPDSSIGTLARGP